MTISILQLFLGFFGAVLIAWASWKTQALSNSGALAALIMGTIVFGLGGLPWALILLVFFISSSALSRFFKKKKAKVEEKFSKSSRRDIGQVWANGGIATLFVIIFVFYPSASWTWWAFSAAFAAVNADTWATELGVLSKKTPGMITTWKLVDPGTSGGVTLLGTSASLAGSALIGVLAVTLSPYPFIINGLISFLIITLAGLAGSLVDSLLGGTIQAIYYCPKCQKETERHPEHLCGHATTFNRGWTFMNNDWVNTACSISASIITILFWYFLNG
ncbi:MAG: DUF92 domain-containing protein [Anaerolineaceae bacterium]|nr:DUF92 domain-containing protein [Anaerolineaceae bacterium]